MEIAPSSDNGEERLFFAFGDLLPELIKFVRCMDILAIRATRRSARGIPKDTALEAGAELYVCGGDNGLCALCSVEHFSQEHGQWEVVPSMLQARVCASGAVMGKRIFVCGGCTAPPGTAKAQNLKSVECFDLQHGRWLPAPDMLERRRGAVSASIDGLLYVCGGEGGADGEYVLSSAERYCPTSGRWEALPPMKSHRFGAAAVAMKGELYICGGSMGLDALRCAEVFVPKRECWKILPDMLEGRFRAAGAHVAGKLYMCGSDQIDLDVATVERLSVGADQWELGPPLATMGLHLAASVCVAGRLLLCGGHRRGSNRCVHTVQRWNVEFGQHEDVPPLVIARAGAVAVRVL